jgi:tRNA threonylcarbamoyl adenosine modification protein YeaZ
MILFIDTSDPAQGRISLISGKSAVDYFWDYDFRNAESLANKIAFFLSKQKIKLGNLKKIAVVVGPGHFSRLRTGLTTANALGFALGLNIVGVKSAKTYNWQKINSAQGKKMVLPAYGKAPNISKPKKRM